MNAGRINTTYRVDFENESYTLQKINKYVFKKPDEVMHNIVLVTEHLRDKIKKAGGDIKRECLEVIKTVEGKPYYIDSDGEYWRAYRYIDGVYTLDENAEDIKLEGAGYGFGKFQNMLSDFDATKLYETIPNFHNEISRFEDFKEAVREDKFKRAEGAKAEIDFCMKRGDDIRKLSIMQQNGELPIRVTHNDTKVNNILIDNEKDEALCVIDLDTVMPGISVLDFGDAARFITNTASEDETDLSKVRIDLKKYEYLARGYLSAVGESLTKTERDNLSQGAKTMTMEIGMRFLTDYLEGDVYFGIDHEGQNLERARCQFALAASMEENFDEMIKIIQSCD
ncbi:MAG: aminoglycoside phosphotransferase family protein [Ruminococcaceae bacterium]|nr:aminoglycoside phosphotransferase family protein [Oscillospiraceae bacterium]